MVSGRTIAARAESRAGTPSNSMGRGGQTEESSGRKEEVVPKILEKEIVVVGA